MSRRTSRRFCRRQAVTMKPRIELAYEWWMSWVKSKLMKATTLASLEELVTAEGLEFDLDQQELFGKNYMGTPSHPEDVVSVTGTLANEFVQYLYSVRHEIINKEANEFSSIVRTTVEHRAMDFLDNVRDAAEEQGMGYYEDLLDEANNPKLLLAAVTPSYMSDEVIDSTPAIRRWKLDLRVPWGRLLDRDRIETELEDLADELHLGLLEDLYVYGEAWFQDRADELDTRWDR